MNYFSVNFWYPGPCRGTDVDNGESSRALYSAEDAFDKVMEFAGIEQIHSYSWPDGSMYKYIRFDLEVNEMERVLKFLFKPTTIRLSGIRQFDKDHQHHLGESLEVMFRKASERKEPRCYHLGGRKYSPTGKYIDWVPSPGTFLGDVCSVFLGKPL